MTGSTNSAATTSSTGTLESLRREIGTLQEELRECKETLDAIRNGDVDAVIVSGADQIARVYTLETADQTYRLLVEEMHEGALTITHAGEILYCNQRLAELVNTAPERVIGGSLQRFVEPQDWSRVLELIHTESKGELSIKTARASSVPSHLSFSRLRSEELGSQDIYCCIVTDMTEQRRTGDQLRDAHAALVAQVAERERTERLLRQSQKMEAIGQLTGGIAHDFNNLLMVITGGLSILDSTPPLERRQKITKSMRQAADRGASLTRQLLAFSRQKELHPSPIAIPKYIGGMRELLDGSLGGTVAVNTEFAADVWPVRVDAGELEIAVLNLCVNARDAMPQGGSITISARNRANLQDLALSGDFVELSIRDTGEGMDADTIARCLEPFYTTKEIGKGSGLGLAQVYGFARGSGGSVQIESELGRGTRVCLLLPRSLATPISSGQRPDISDSAIARRPTCTVLLVEDDVTVASLTDDMLRELGYEVVQVADAQAGLQAIAANSAIGLVMSDVMMPGAMDGLSFAKELKRRKSALPVVLVTGMPQAVSGEAQKLDIPLLAKPYDLPALASHLAAALAAATLSTQR